MERRAWVWSTLLLVIAFACGLGQRVQGSEPAPAAIPTTIGRTAGPSRSLSAVYPPQRLPLRFDHGAHLARGIDCEQCHRDLRKSRHSSDNNLPRGKQCDECHGKQHPLPPGETARCQLCHTRSEGARVSQTARIPPANLHFDHQRHLERGASCKQCHGDFSRVRLATAQQLPSEENCLTCHDGRQASRSCESCHPSEPSGRLILRAHDRLGATPLVPKADSPWSAMAHDLAFVEDHAAIAKTQPERCASCHDDDFCQECHAGAIRPLRIHSGDYIATHAMDARARTQDCQACHRLQNDCRACHERLGVAQGRPETAFGVGSSFRFHPAGWAGGPGQPQGHAFPAQRNLATCASCHDEDSCLSCHATTQAAQPGLNVSPHGSGFAQSLRCRTLASRNRRVCLRCHAPGDAKLDCL